MQTLTLEFKIEFGKHKGLTVSEILNIDASYIVWLLQNIPNFFLPLETVKQWAKTHPEFQMLFEYKNLYYKKLVEKGAIPLPILTYNHIDRLYHTYYNESLMPEFGRKNPFGDFHNYISFAFSDYPQWVKNVSYWEYARLNTDENGIPQITISFNRLATILKYEGDKLTIAYEPDLKHNKYNPHLHSIDKLQFYVKADEHEFLEVARRCLALNLLMIR
jgi:hypothetical protein